MFADAMIEIGSRALIALINMFPASDPEIIAVLVNFSQQMYSHLNNISYFIPVNTLIKYIGYILVIEGLVLFVKFLKWVFAVVIIKLLVKFVPRII